MGVLFDWPQLCSAAAAAAAPAFQLINLSKNFDEFKQHQITLPTEILFLSILQPGGLTAFPTSDKFLGHPQKGLLCEKK